MQTMEADVNRLDTRLKAGCSECGGVIRIFGIESHPFKRDVEIRSFVCLGCDQIECEEISLAPQL